MAALQTFCCSTALLSSRTLARAAGVCPTRRSLLGYRHYSEDKVTEDAQKAKDSAKEEEPALTPEQEKLKAKEAEVVDLTVCVMSSISGPTILIRPFGHRAAFGTSKLISSICNATLHERRSRPEISPSPGLPPTCWRRQMSSHWP